MKTIKIFVALALSIVVGAACISCSKDKDNEPGLPNTITWTEVPKEITKVEFYQTPEKTYYRLETAPGPDRYILELDIPTEWTSLRGGVFKSTESYRVMFKNAGYDLTLLPSPDYSIPSVEKDGTIIAKRGEKIHEIDLRIYARVGSRRFPLTAYYKGPVTYKPSLGPTQPPDPEL